MRKISEIRRLGKMIERVEKRGNVQFLSKNYEKTFGWQSMNFETMRKLDFLKVVDVEYYDVEIDVVSNEVFAVKGDEKIRIRDYWREKKFAQKLGYEIVVEENYIKTVKGKRYTYEFDIDKMKQNYNDSVIEYRKFKRCQAQRLVDKLSTRVERISQRLDTAEKNLCDVINKVNNADCTYGLQLM